MTNWSPQQERALKEVAAWLEAKDRPVFRLFGFAGTGKTTLARHLGDQIEGKVLYAAFTGKAAMVLRSKGCDGASTIHSLIYTLDEENKGAPTFILDPESDLKNAALCIIDECSMVDTELGKDLLSFGVPVLVLGDPEQLPPVKGAGFFTECAPDFMLSEVHRQARDNPIIRMSMDVREGRGLAQGGYGESRVISRREINAEMILGADQVLVGRNLTRSNYNRRIRTLKGFTSPMPEVAEKLVCLRNNRKKGLLNGGIWKVDQVLERKSKYPETARMILDPDDAGGRQKAVEAEVRQEFFLGTADNMPWEILKATDQFDFGYALTVHKSQGSQWGSVVLFDESGVFHDDARRWLYTGITRAAERVTVVGA